MGATTLSGLGSTGATLGTEITPGYGDTVYLFEYGTTPKYGQASALSESIGSDNTSHSVSTALTGLTPGTTYYARAVATNFGGTTHGAPMSFTTPNLPQIESAFASECCGHHRQARSAGQPGAQLDDRPLRIRNRPALRAEHAGDRDRRRHGPA